MGCFGYICKGCGTPIIGKSYDGGGESCVMYHVRHGEVKGSVEGHYNGYGGVWEQENLQDYEQFRGECEPNGNSHYDICQSEFEMEDSYEPLCSMRLYKGRKIRFVDFMIAEFLDDLRGVNYCISKLPYYHIYNRYISKKSTLYELHQKYLEHLNKYRKCTDGRDLLHITNLEFTARLIFENLYHIFAEMEDKYFMKKFNELPCIELKAYSGVVAYHSVCFRKAMRDGTFNLIPSIQDENQGCGTVRKKYKDGGNYEPKKRY